MKRNEMSGRYKRYRRADQQIHKSERKTSKEEAPSGSLAEIGGYYYK
jgi:hypothetical protein